MSQHNSYNANKNPNHPFNFDHHQSSGQADSQGQKGQNQYPGGYQSSYQSGYQNSPRQRDYYGQQNLDIRDQSYSPYNQQTSWQAAYDRPTSASKSKSRIFLWAGLSAFLVIVAAVLLIVRRIDKPSQSQRPNLAANYITNQDSLHQGSIQENPVDSNTVHVENVPSSPIKNKESDSTESQNIQNTGNQSSSQNLQQPGYMTAFYESIETYKTPVPSQKSASSSCPASLLRVGDYAFVNPSTGGTTLRDGPYGVIAGHEGDKAYPGAIFEVLDGPICDAGVNMFSLKTTWDTEFWGPEAPHAGNEWWLLPLHTRSVCPGSKPTRLLVGMKAFVLEYPDDPVEVYPEPDLNSGYFYQIPPTQHDTARSVRQKTEAFDLLKGPHCDGKGANWWYVGLKNGQKGWIRESGPAHNYYYIGPYYD